MSVRNIRQWTAGGQPLTVTLKLGEHRFRVAGQIELITEFTTDGRISALTLVAEKVETS